MRIHHFLFLISFIFLFSFGFSLNLALTDYHNPQANHILDAEIVGDVLIVSAMVQGIEFYDISNPGELNLLTNFNLTSGGGGGGTKANCVRAADMNQDGNIDILDVVLIVNTILG